MREAIRPNQTQSEAISEAISAPSRATHLTAALRSEAISEAISAPSRATHLTAALQSEAISEAISAPSRATHLTAALLQLLAKATQEREGVEKGALEALGLGHTQPEGAREHRDAHPIPVGTWSAVVSACMRGRAPLCLRT